jgi:hypothetical protein
MYVCLLHHLIDNLSMNAAEFSTKSIEMDLSRLLKAEASTSVASVDASTAIRK